MTDPPGSNGTIRVVLADDTSDIRLLLAVALRVAGGFEVVGQAGDGEEAVRLTAELTPDVILLDLAMPVMDGLQALPLLLAASPGTRVVVLSGFGAEAMAEEALELGASDYVQKGISPPDLAQRLRDVVSRSAG